jgi:hypothetical protein
MVKLLDTSQNMTNNTTSILCTESQQEEKREKLIPSDSAFGRCYYGAVADLRERRRTFR